MKWLYYIVHDWGDSQNTDWEDVWLKPDVPEEDVPSIWLTVDSLSSGEDDRVKRLGSAPYMIEDMDMLANVECFTKDALIEYANIWLNSAGFKDTVLVAGTFECFTGTNQQAILHEELRGRRNVRF